ncbi:MAG: FHA domain-containing protein [Verrucomicrobiota bacterium]
MSDLIKRCRCGYENPETESFCLKCGQPILGLEAVSPATATQTASTQPPTARARKKCPRCGNLNEAYAILCTCGTPLEANTSPAETSQADEESTPLPESDAAPLPGSLPATTSAPDVTLRESRLYLVVGAAQYECHEGDFLGREGTIANQVFNAIKTVSRRHVRISKHGGQWHLAPLPGVVNKTLLDGRDLPADGSALTADHTLRMSSQCEVKLRVIA